MFVWTNILVINQTLDNVTAVKQCGVWNNDSICLVARSRPHCKGFPTWLSVAVLYGLDLYCSPFSGSLHSLLCVCLCCFYFTYLCFTISFLIHFYIHHKPSKLNIFEYPPLPPCKECRGGSCGDSTTSDLWGTICCLGKAECLDAINLLCVPHKYICHVLLCVCLLTTAFILFVFFVWS